jgi:ectoine hydroxylase-related dioxygenase (phytanoyl-CoA dioxygenase family)
MNEMSLSILPEMNESYTLTKAQISNYQKNGHIMLQEVAAKEEVDIYEQIISKRVQELNYHTKSIEERDTYGKAFIQITNLREQSEPVKRFVFAKRFAKIAADLMSVEGVRIFADQALFKEPGGGYTPWHQDQIYWPLSTPKTITMWMPLVHVSKEVGSMSFASASQDYGYISKMLISDESHKSLGGLIEGKGLEVITYGELQAGDATFHSGWTLHSAPGNPTENIREVMTVIYVEDGARIAEYDSKARELNSAKLMPGLKPGDLVSSSLNPLVYSRAAKL